MSEDLEKRTRQYVLLRDTVKALKEKHAAELKPYGIAMAAIEGVMLASLDAAGATSMKTDAGTFYKTTQASTSIADSNEFSRHVIGSQAWELLDWRANKTAIQAILDAGGQLPPGINYSTFTKVGVRRANETSND